MLPGFSILLIQVAFLPISLRQALLMLFALHPSAPSEQHHGVETLTGRDTRRLCALFALQPSTALPVLGDHRSHWVGFFYYVDDLFFILFLSNSNPQFVVLKITSASPIQTGGYWMDIGCLLSSVVSQVWFHISLISTIGTFLCIYEEIILGWSVVLLMMYLRTS